MKKLLLILLCFPIIGFGQLKNNKSTFNFNKTNSYNTEYSKTIAKKYYNSTSNFNFNKHIKAQNDSTSSFTFYSQNKNNYSHFNKGLINFLSKAIQKGKDDNPPILKKKNKNIY